MGFENRFFTAAETEINGIRMRNRNTENTRAAEIRRKCPEAAEIQDKLAGTSARLLSVIADREGDITAKLSELERENLELQARLRTTLVKNGYPAEYLDPVYNCRICRDTGIADGKRCRCFMDMVKRAASDELNRTSPLKLCSFRDFDLSYYDDSAIVPEIGTTARKAMEYNLKVCIDYAENFHLPCKSMLMRGKTGLGKTHLSLSIASAVLEKGYSVIYGSAPDILRRIENEHFNRAERDANTLDMLIKTDLLVLDDVGAEYEKSNFYHMVIYNILNDRMNASLPTIISTNLTHDELEKRYDERTFSRMFTMDELLFAGKDIRILKAGMQ